jgi:hypothetical protein
MGGEWGDLELGGLVGEEWGGSRYSMGDRDLGGPIVMKEGGVGIGGGNGRVFGITGLGGCLVLEETVSTLVS